MNDSASDILKPAILCGGALGFLAGLPVFDLFNCCTCCSMGIGAGLFAAFLYSKTCARGGIPFDAGRAAGVGALTGFFWGLSNVVVSTLVAAAFGEVLADWFMPILEGNPSMPPELLDQIELGMEQGVTAVSIIIDAVITLSLGVVFATIGGLIGAAVFKSEPAVPASPETGNPVT
jgi:amino acid transporter